MKFWVGLAIGAALGASAMYLGLKRPWRGAPAPPPVAAIAPPPVDAGVAPTGKKKRGKRVATTSSAGGAAEREVDDDVVLTDADRKVEWRGDAVAAPPRLIDMEAADARALDDDEIAAGIAGGSRAVVDCIKDAAGPAPLSGEVTLKMLVGGDGRVTKARVRAAVYLHEHGLTACARRAARGFSFAATGAPTVVTAPFYLN
ncbi:MAG: hypothetical protein IPL61_09745 [Myxococcales bacterium]|nr:hypothetical protein [Myxococcales bacterium]